MINPNRAPITTHVLNIATGKPAEGIEIMLEKQNGSNWAAIKTAKANADGRVDDLMAKGTKADAGVYRMTFQTGAYFKNDTFYPRAEVIFEIKSTDQHYHVPLLVSPYGYSTYRGS